MTKPAKGQLASVDSVDRNVDIVLDVALDHLLDD